MEVRFRERGKSHSAVAVPHHCRPLYMPFFHVTYIMPNHAAFLAYKQVKFTQGSQPTGRSGESGKTEICHPDRERAGNSVQITVIREIAGIAVALVNVVFLL